MEKNAGTDENKDVEKARCYSDLLFDALWPTEQAVTPPKMHAQPWRRIPWGGTP